MTVALEPLTYDKTTGLPALPVGFAWKVEENEYASYEEDPEETELVVRVVKAMSEDQSWWDRMIGREPTTIWAAYGHEFSDEREKCANDVEDLKAAASAVYNTVRDAQVRSEKLKTLVGLYPPKSIL